MIPKKNFSFSAMLMDVRNGSHCTTSCVVVKIHTGKQHFFMKTYHLYMKFFKNHEFWKVFFSTDRPDFFWNRTDRYFFSDFPPNTFFRFWIHDFLILVHFPRVLHSCMESCRCGRYIISFEVSFGGEFRDAL